MRRAIGEALRMAARFALDALKRRSEARDAVACVACQHRRDAHCGCGMHCLHYENMKDFRGCDCAGFVEQR